ncbi:acyltransferase domain-containing protein [Actinoplanes sp. NBRC 103695]|uniref:acyltransferase domain-containing protein n=1 Tax=Actinoplanes sp. NBRC 103695 TaxID=3032202 RepID=UPI0024A1A207|nr:acyltransferase domain-containing protein [Actinoplanes sp. NBRC 103695]GLZ00729.1 hypothetical protein Acsp02_79810 [Actinoplanes sp. NBRC 103695]
MTKQIVLLLPGQGSQYAGMAVPVHRREPVFARVCDEFFDAMGADGAGLRRSWLGADPEEPVDDGRWAQPLLFIVGYGLGRVLESRGVRPSALLGHSVGELAAAALAGVFDLPAAARILRGRSRVLAGAPPGGMLAVAATPDRAAALVHPDWAAAGLVVGAVNAPAQTILAGPEPELTLAETAIRDAGVIARRVRSRQPFHSPVLADAARAFEKVISGEALHPPRIPVRSARTGRMVEPHEAVDPAFWAHLMCEPVLFWPALQGFAADGDWVFAEAGPGNGLSTAARRHPSVIARRGEVVTLLPPAGTDQWPVWEAGRQRLTQLSDEPGSEPGGDGETCTAR